MERTIFLYFDKILDCIANIRYTYCPHQSLKRITFRVKSSDTTLSCLN